MHTDIEYIHHVGHVVRDIEHAWEYYHRLGFLCSAPAYPLLSRSADEPAKPFGAANMHAAFARNFVKIMAVVTHESHLPPDARPIPFWFRQKLFLVWLRTLNKPSRESLPHSNVLKDYTFSCSRWQKRWAFTQKD